MKLRVSDNRRFLVKEDGKPFFYQGDTAWELFHRLDRADTLHYLRTRAAQGFTVIQAVALAEFRGLDEPNREGHLPLWDQNPARPNPAYFDHVDFAVDQANDLGLTIAFLPTWGDKWNRKWGEGPEVFTPENAAIYGEWLGKRYRGKSLIWMLGGDRPVESETHLAILRAMARGIREGDGGEHLITAHVSGGSSSSQWLHEENWLDFNTCQSGHSHRNSDNYRTIAQDYAKTPTKPCMDSESAYESHPVNWNDKGDLFGAVEVRRPSYWGVFAGGHGFTYGNHLVWQFLTPDHPPISYAKGHWRSALEEPAGKQMVHLKKLMLSRPFLTRIPDQTMLIGDAGKGESHLQATRDEGGHYAMVYFPGPVSAELDLRVLGGDSLVAHWYDPRTGETRQKEAVPRTATAKFTPPSTPEALDWVLVLDRADHDYTEPGR